MRLPCALDQMLAGLNCSRMIPIFPEGSLSVLSYIAFQTYATGYQLQRIGDNISSSLIYHKKVNVI